MASDRKSQAANRIPIRFEDEEPNEAGTEIASTDLDARRWAK